MEQSVEKIIERNLLEVFNAREADSRRAALDELWDKDGVFVDPDGVHEGVEKINAIVQLLFTQFEDYVFSVRGPGQSMHGVGRLPWSYGPADHRPAFAKVSSLARLAPRENHSERSACMTSTRAARAAGSIEATTAAPNSTNAETITGNAPGIFKSPK
jgi:hypothetical protein